MTHLRITLLNLALLLAAVLLSVGLGAVMIPPLTLGRLLLARLPGIISPEAVDWPAMFETIVYQIRLPHTALVALTGAALSTSGAAYQGLFRNPLADPYLIGVASGAGLGAVTALAARRWLAALGADIFGLFTVPAAAFLGAALTVAVVYSLARVGRTTPTTNLILAGVAVSAFASALTSFLMLRSNEELRRAIGWLLGGSILSGWEPVAAMLPYVMIGMGFLLASGHTLNVLQFGEEQAQQLGINVERMRLLLVLAASLTAAAAVAFSGVIGFIGLIVPHVARMIVGPDHRRLLPHAAIGGGTALLLADVLARIVLAPQTLPVGIVTALAGGPFFLWILRRAKNEVFW